MAVADIIFLVIIVLSSVVGGFRGLIKEALSLVAWVAAVVIAGLFNAQLADIMVGVIDNDFLRRIVAFGLLFVLTIFLGTLISNLISKLTSAAGLGSTDRILGGLFGVLRGLIIIVLIVLFTRPFEFSQEWYESSLLVPYISMLSNYLQSLMGDVQAGIA